MYIFCQLEALCVICMCDLRSVVCIPCGHMVLCQGCWDELKPSAAGSKDCPMCREPVTMTVPIAD